MSAPKRGMVAGQAIITQAQSAEYDDGYERIFGKDRKPQRGRFVWSKEAQAMVEVGADWDDAPRKAPHVTEEIIYGNLRTTDGVDISSRRKRREYMRATGVTDSSDFSPGFYERVKKDKRNEQDRQRKQDLISTYKQLRRE